MYKECRKGISYDGHERADFKISHDEIFLPLMANYNTWFMSRNKELNIVPDLQHLSDEIQL